MTIDNSNYYNYNYELSFKRDFGLLTSLRMHASTFENYIFVEYIYHMHQSLKLNLSTTITYIASLNTSTYLRYMSMETHNPWSSTLYMNFSIHFYMLSLTRVMT